MLNFLKCKYYTLARILKSGLNINSSLNVVLMPHLNLTPGLNELFKPEFIIQFLKSGLTKTEILVWFNFDNFVHKFKPGVPVV